MFLKLSFVCTYIGIFQTSVSKVCKQILSRRSCSENTEMIVEKVRAKCSPHPELRRIKGRVVPENVLAISFK
jgi:hypothetical protein